MDAVSALVNHGRWIVRCPACPSGRQVTPGEAEFVCFSESPRCPAFGIRWAITWPSERNLRDIESALARRPELRNRNWEAHESPADLWSENERRGVD